MRLPSSIRPGCAAAVSALALSVSAPANAQPGGYPDAMPGDVPGPDWQVQREAYPQPAPYPQRMTEPARDSWLDECRRRLSIRHHRDDRGPDRCESYYDDYYARYQGGHGYPGPGYGPYPGHPPMQAYPAYGYGGGCCQPMMMVPVMMMPRGEPECTETVEYEYEYVDVPARPAPRRPVRPAPAPDKRVKVVPDKRIPVK